MIRDSLEWIFKFEKMRGRHNLDLIGGSSHGVSPVLDTLTYHILSIDTSITLLSINTVYY